MSGRVYTHAAQPLERDHYDFAVVGGGLLGLACAFWIKHLEPEASLLIVEEGGIPREGGATHNSSATFGLYRLRERQNEAQWVREVLGTLEAVTGVSRPHDPRFQGVGKLDLLHSPPVEDVPDSFQQLEPADFARVLSPAAYSNLERLADLSDVHIGVYDPLGGYGSASSAALHFGYGAVKRGADLMLSTRAGWQGGRLTLERLDIDRQMRVFTAHTDAGQVDRLIVAAGADTGLWLERHLDLLCPLPRTFVQHLRLNEKSPLERTDGEVVLPVLEGAGFQLRPHLGGVLLRLPTLGPDPAGYVPTGGELMGVSVGLRREQLEMLLNAAPSFPCLEWDTLDLGKTAADLLGSWEVARAFPEWQEVTPGVYAVTGGQRGFELGLSTAYDLASSVLGQVGRPWSSQRSQDR